MLTRFFLMLCVLSVWAPFPQTAKAGNAEPANARSSPRPDRARAAEIDEQRSTIESFRRSLEKAKTPTEKRAVMERWREHNQVRIERTLGQESRSRTSEGTAAQTRMAPAGNRKLPARTEQMEKQLAEMEKTKARLERIRQAEGQEKRKLIRELQTERAEQAEVRSREPEARQEVVRTRNEREPAARPLPPGIAERIADYQERRKTMEGLREASGNGDAEERSQAREAFRRLLDATRENPRRQPDERNKSPKQAQPRVGS